MTAGKVDKLAKTCQNVVYIDKENIRGKVNIITFLFL